MHCTCFAPLLSATVSSVFIWITAAPYFARSRISTRRQCLSRLRGRDSTTRTRSPTPASLPSRRGPSASWCGSGTSCTAGAASAPWTSSTMVFCHLRAHHPPGQRLFLLRRLLLPAPRHAPCRLRIPSSCSCISVVTRARRRRTVRFERGLSTCPMMPLKLTSSYCFAQLLPLHLAAPRGSAPCTNPSSPSLRLAREEPRLDRELAARPDAWPPRRWPRSTPPSSNITVPGLTGATQYSGVPLPLPMRVSAGFLV